MGRPVSATTVAKILQPAGVSPAGARAERSWREFPPYPRRVDDRLRLCTLETLRLGSLYAVFFIDLGARRVQLAGRTQTLTASGTLSRPASLPRRSPSGRARSGF
jgi:hypothetical protein